MVRLFLLFAMLPGAAGSFRLPATAKIKIFPAHMLPGYPPQVIDDCAKRRLSSMQVRRMFAAYHELKERELHDGYQVEGCVIEGEVLINGKTYRFRIQPINLMWTDWPDGPKPNQEGHSLGGTHSDETDQ